MGTEPIKFNEEIEFWDYVFKLFWGSDTCKEENTKYSTIYKYECGGIRDNIIHNIEVYGLLFGECYISELFRPFIVDFYLTFGSVQLEKLTVKDCSQLMKAFRNTYEHWIHTD